MCRTRRRLRRLRVRFGGCGAFNFTYVPASVEALLVDDIVGFLQT